MPGVGGGAVDDRLFTERIASVSRFDRLSRRLLGTDAYAPYLLIVAVYLFDVPFLHLVEVVLGRPQPFAPVANPALAVMLPGLLFVLYAARDLRDRFESVIDDLPEAGPTPTEGEERRGSARVWHAVLHLTATRRDGEYAPRELTSPRTAVGLLLLIWGLYVAFNLANPDAPEEMYRNTFFAIATLKAFVTIPFILVVGVDFLRAYVGAILVLPLEIRERGIIDFRDPIGYGHLKPVGDLIGRASVLSLVGFAFYVVFTAGGVAVGDPAYFPVVGPVLSIVIAGGVAVLVALFFFPVVLLHGHMRDAKHRKITEISEQVRASGPDGEMFPETAIPHDPDVARQYSQLFIHLRKVENTREYPIDVTHVQELVLAGLVPILADVSLGVLFEYLGH